MAVLQSVITNDSRGKHELIAWTNFQNDALFETDILNFLKAVALPHFSRVSVRHAAKILE
jgi:hypothetical protein